jgi:DNA topoisomerase III
MKRFADSIARQKSIKPPPGYMKSGSVCRAFLDQHAPKKTDVGTSGTSGVKPASPAQILFAENIAQENGIVIPDETKASSVAMSAWIESNHRKKHVKGRRKTADKPTRSTAPESSAPRKKSRKKKTDAVAAPPTPARQDSGTDTSLRIPYGNKEDALKLGARYRSGGWYAPPGVDLGAFAERGWL